MKELIVNIPDEALSFVEEFVERIGGTVVTSSKKSEKKPDLKPFDFFGTWEQIPLDPNNYRKKLWRKVPEF